MGEAEAPAPPPAVPQNPIKIFISGNSGNKEVSSSQGFIGGLIRVYWGAFWAVPCPRITATLLEPGQKLSPFPPHASCQYSHCHPLLMKNFPDDIQFF